jgi:hypothetical protein
MAATCARFIAIPRQNTPRRHIPTPRKPHASINRSTKVDSFSGSHASGPQFPHPRRLYRGRAALVDAGGLGLGDPFELALAPEVRLELSEHAEHVEEAFAGGRAGVDRLLGCLKRGLRTMSCRSPMLRARRSIRVPMRTSPACRNSSTVRSASRPSVVVPLRFSARMTSQPAARSAISWIERSWSVVLTRAYPMMVTVPAVSFSSRSCLYAVLKGESQPY